MANIVYRVLVLIFIQAYKFLFFLLEICTCRKNVVPLHCEPAPRVSV